MDFSAWDWSDSFRLQDAACLIAGVMPISKRNLTSEEMPPQARPIFIKLTAAYIEWLLQEKNPERPKSQVLEGYKEEDGSFPPFPGLKTIGTEIIPRQAIHRFLSETGRKSVYDFQPIPVGAIGATEPAPVVETKEQRQDNRLRACKAAGLVMPVNSMGRLPDGVGDVADRHGVSRQAFSADVKAALKRREAITKPGRVVRIA